MEPSNGVCVSVMPYSRLSHHYTLRLVDEGHKIPTHYCCDRGLSSLLINEIELSEFEYTTL